LNALQIAITDVHQTCHQGRFPGDEVNYCFFFVEIQSITVPHVSPKPLLVRTSSQLKPTESVSAYFLTTDSLKLSSQNMTRLSKKLNYTKYLELGDKGGMNRVTVPTYKILGPPPYFDNSWS